MSQPGVQAAPQGQYGPPSGGQLPPGQQPPQMTQYQGQHPVSQPAQYSAENISSMQKVYRAF